MKLDLSDLAARAIPTCPTCDGTGLVEGDTCEVVDAFGTVLASVCTGDKVCGCVPIRFVAVRTLGTALCVVDEQGFTQWSGHD